MYLFNSFKFPRKAKHCWLFPLKIFSYMLYKVAKCPMGLCEIPPFLPCSLPRLWSDDAFFAENLCHYCRLLLFIFQPLLDYKHRKGFFRVPWLLRNEDLTFLLLLLAFYDALQYNSQLLEGLPKIIKIWNVNLN